MCAANDDDPAAAQIPLRWRRAAAAALAAGAPGEAEAAAGRQRCRRPVLRRRCSAGFRPPAAAGQRCAIGSRHGRPATGGSPPGTPARRPTPPSAALPGRRCAACCRAPGPPTRGWWPSAGRRRARSRRGRAGGARRAGAGRRALDGLRSTGECRSCRLCRHPSGGWVCDPWPLSGSARPPSPTSPGFRPARCSGWRPRGRCPALPGSVPAGAACGPTVRRRCGSGSSSGRPRRVRQSLPAPVPRQLPPGAQLPRRSLHRHDQPQGAARHRLGPAQGGCGQRHHQPRSHRDFGGAGDGG